MTSLHLAMDITDRDRQLLSELKNLLGNVSASDLRKSLEDFLFSYLKQKGAIQPDMQMVCHFYFLMLFLREVE